MNLRPIAEAEVELVVGWLRAKENWQWLDFGRGIQRLDPIVLRVMGQQDAHLLRVYAPGASHDPVGLVALSDVSRPFRSAMLWYVLGDKRWAGQGVTTRAVSRLLSIGFADLGLQTVNAWVVDGNTPSLRVLVRNHFRPIGRQRRCHYIDGIPYDRLLFDLLAEEYMEVEDDV